MGSVMAYKATVYAVEPSIALTQLVKLAAPIAGESDVMAIQRRTVYRNIASSVLCSCYLAPAIRKNVLDAAMTLVNDSNGKFLGLEAIVLSMLTDPNLSYDTAVTVVQDWVYNFDGDVFDGGTLFYNFATNRASLLTSDTVTSLERTGINGQVINFNDIPNIPANLESIASYFLDDPFNRGESAIREAVEPYAGSSSGSFQVWALSIAAVGAVVVAAGCWSEVALPGNPVGAVVVAVGVTIEAGVAVAEAIHAITQNSSDSASATVQSDPPAATPASGEDGSSQVVGTTSTPDDSQGDSGDPGDPGGGVCVFCGDGTMQVRTSGGLHVPLSRLRPGDFVYSENDDGQPIMAKVSSVRAVPLQKLIRVALHNGEVLRTTDSHRYALHQANSTTRADMLETGAKLITATGEPITVSQIDVIDIKRAVYKVSLAGAAHIYYLGDSEIRSDADKEQGS
jgi:hypothetical protein